MRDYEKKTPSLVIQKNSSNQQSSAQSSTTQMMSLQRAAGNRAVSQLMRTKSGQGGSEAPSEGSGVIQRVAVKLQAGLDADKPSTYDAGGGHSYCDHGAQTTEAQQRERLKSGTAPSGRVSKVPMGKAASKFSSDDKHKTAFKQALADITTKNANKQKVKGAGNVISVPGAGVSYHRDNTTTNSDKVQLDIMSVSNDTIRINSMYPV